MFLLGLICCLNVSHVYGLNDDRIGWRFAWDKRINANSNWDWMSWVKTRIAIKFAIIFLFKSFVFPIKWWIMDKLIWFCKRISEFSILFSMLVYKWIEPSAATHCADGLEKSRIILPSPSNHRVINRTELFTYSTILVIEYKHTKTHAHTKQTWEYKCVLKETNWIMIVVKEQYRCWYI